MTPKPAKVPVSERALIQRVNRKLAESDEMVKTARYVSDGRGGWREHPELGRYYIIDRRRNFLIAKDVDLEEVARENGALKPWEELAE